MKNMNWMDKPVTWRTYLRLSAVVYAISLVGMSIYYAILWWDDLTMWVQKTFDSIKHKMGF